LFDLLKKLDTGVRRSRQAFFGRIVDLFDRQQIDDDLWVSLEDLLLQADVGVATVDRVLTRTRLRVESDRVRSAEGARDVLVSELAAVFGAPERSVLDLRPGRVNVVLVVGVNGSGKTTSIAKLAALLRRQGKSVVLGAADTFRAAAIDQLRIWAERADVPVVAHQPGADPGAVVFDSWQAARARGADVLIVDTAGRLHTKSNLMAELAKVARVLTKLDPTAPHEVLLVLDATTGQNALSQAREFLATSGVTGLILTKIDGTARGGAVFAVAAELGLPIKYLGTGETIEDLAGFDPVPFVQALLRDERTPAS
jgi:fused signal recognition particle receptor